jgi:hypothetical protein
MTLNITIVSAGAVYQSTDFRLSVRDPGSRSYEPIKKIAHKHLTFMRPGWTALVAFAGIGLMSSFDVDAWLAKKERELAYTATYEDLIGLLSEANQWLRKVANADRYHTFTLAGFLGRQPFASLLSTYQTVTGQSVLAPHKELVLSTIRPRRPKLVLSGRVESVTGADRKRLLAAARQQAERQAMLALLAQTNVNAAHTDRTVSEACWTSYLSRDGKSYGELHGSIPDRYDSVSPSDRKLLSSIGPGQLPDLFDERGNLRSTLRIVQELSVDRPDD